MYFCSPDVYPVLLFAEIFPGRRNRRCGQRIEGREEAVMEVRRYDRSYDDAVYRLWSGSGVKQGFVPLQRDEFDRLLLENIHFSSDYAFLLIKEACVCGFVCGCGEEERPETKDLGLFSCMLIEEPKDTE